MFRVGLNSIEYSQVGMNYKYRTKPYDHQRKLFEETWDKEYFAVFWEQGTGKTKVTLDTAAALYLDGKIDCLLVVAPNGVHRNWVVEEIGIHMPEVVLEETVSFAYQSSKAGTKKAQRAAQEAADAPGLAVVAMSYDAFITKRGAALAALLLKTRKCLMVLDESARIKSPKARRTKAILKASPKALYRRILTGTPIANGPFDIYTQMDYLKRKYWKDEGLNNFTIFKNYFANWVDQYLPSTGRTFKQLVSYKNLAELNEIIQKDSSRVTKDDVLDLPPKIYAKRFFQMSPKQDRMYRDLKDNFMVTLDGGEMVTADLALTRLLRLQQITCGYVTTETILPDPEDTDFYEIIQRTRDIEEDNNSRLKLLIEILEDTPHKAIIWARFTRDIDLIMNYLGDRAVRYDGKTSDDERAEALDSFQHGKHGDAQFFVANAQAAGEGLTLTQARTVIYYNNNFKLTERLQSEDRAHRIGQNFPVNYIDIVAIDTVDERIIDALRSKRDIASQITGDELKEWL